MATNTKQWTEVRGQTRHPRFIEPWSCRTFGEIAAPVRDRTTPAAVPGNTQLVELEQIEPGTGRLLGRATASNAVSLKTVFRKNDVLFGKLRAYLRKYWLADSDGLCTTEIWALRAKNGSVPEFVRYVVETERFIEVASGAYGTHMPRSDWGSVGNLELMVPSQPEQRVIAEVLTDAYDLITTLDRLIVKKQAIKQGMMQELLAGRTRLPGFTEPWRRTDVGDLVEQHRTAVDPRSHLATLFQHFSLPAFDDSETPVLEVGASIDSQKMRVPVGAVLISKLNPRIPRIWVTSRVRENAIASTEFIVLTARQGVDRAYLGWLLKSAPIASRMKLLAVGTTGSHARIHPRQVQALECSVPKLKEQKAIASVLDDVATELDRLRTRLDKAKAIKQGMMQELLTGQTRLPIGGLVR